jgi:hypothetical protein
MKKRYELAKRHFGGEIIMSKEIATLAGGCFR